MHAPATLLDAIAAPPLALPGIRHAFFTRRGGVSDGPFASLNCGFASGDEAERVRANRARAMAGLGMAASSLTTVRQVHSAAVVTVTEPGPHVAATPADGLVTARPGITLGVLCADCAPVLLADPQAGVVGAAHAGWRGALQGIVEATVAAMADLGASPRRIVAAVGPCIAEPSYEVGPDMEAQFAAADPAGLELFTPVAGSDRLRFDLAAYVRQRLARAAVAASEALAADTLADEARFFSARRARTRGDGRFGLLLSAITLVDPTR
jgi:polyphenol oxidase